MRTGPRPRGKVVSQPAHGRADHRFGQEGESGHVPADTRVEVRVRPAPVGTHNTVAKIGGHRQLDDRDGSQPITYLVEARSPEFELGDLGHVLAYKPLFHVAQRVVGEHHPKRSDATQLIEAQSPISPMMDGEHSEDGLSRRIGKGEVLGYRSNSRRGTDWPLAEHYVGWIDGDDTSRRRLVRTRPGAHVDERTGGTQRCLYRPRPGWIRPTADGVADPDLVVGGSRRGQTTGVGADGTGGQVSPPMPGMNPAAFLFRSPITLETTTAASPPTRRSKSRFTMGPPY